MMNPREVFTRLRQESRPYRFVMSRLLWRSGFSHHFVVRRNGYRVRFHPSAVSAGTWTEPDTTSQEEAFVASRLRQGDCYVDVGSNIGLLALRAATVVGPAGRVIAIEAHPRTYRFLVDNVALNAFSWVQPMHCAVGKETGTLMFSDELSDDQNHVVVEGTGVEVPVERLDDLVPDGPIALLKVDVEGFELPVLLGAPRVLARTRCILLESWDEHAARYGFTVANVAALLRDSGFTIFRFAGDGLQPVVGAVSSSRCENLVAIRE